jgi:hypothetical protein
MEQSRRQRRATKRLHSQMSDRQGVINFILAMLPGEFACDYRVECDLDGARSECSGIAATKPGRSPKECARRDQTVAGGLHVGSPQHGQRRRDSSCGRGRRKHGLGRGSLP